ncbi:2-aminoethylphosphonate aminotransferase [Leadbettera azotonutricia]|uniref:2-aminoethylphosphonate--pyruvate transaminase n=1 Tax=Leadbettera azotonutricia (strain ATCC BAA-888 / DSM 13862 / ZAS-9) TaxID=545695 RepID=F5Y8P0_LEAAZ|nr:2-aminoethylphosphonate--pyruvate transaminase [Leadbettera azotonutricia]AEF81797.1 nucleotidyl transferase/aminotransferase, class V [Leadbettera azotonutricia ZAS-9]
MIRYAVLLSGEMDFCTIGGIPLIEHTVRKLFASGIEEMFIVVHADSAAGYAELKSRYPGIVITTGAFQISGDFLFLRSGLLFDAIAFHVLINEARPDVQLASGSGEPIGIAKLQNSALEKMYPKMEIPSQAVTRKIATLLWGKIETGAAAQKTEQDLYPLIQEAEGLRSVRREVLLNPGPATTSDSVKYAQICADICPREKEFGNLMEWICTELSLMAGKPGRVETVLFGGSGTAADEVMISSCVPDEGKLLIVDNGAYGERFAKIAKVYKLNFEVFKSSGFKPLDTEAVKTKLIEGAFTHFAIVYHETTTGLLNPAPELCRFCHEHGITTIVDTVSAFAAIPIDMDRDGFDFMASTSNKNIQGMAGAALVFCRKEALAQISAYPMRNYYLNLQDQYNGFKKTKQTRFTPPVQTLYALRQAIIEAKIETIEKRYIRYSACWDILVKTVKKLGLSMLVPEAAQSKLITAIIDPASPAYSFDALHDLARSKSFTIYPGKLSDANTFRIANIGDIQPEEMTAFVKILEDYIQTL